MIWKKTRITMNVFQAGDYRITENPESNPDERFRLDTFSADGEVAEPQTFSTLDAAKRAAATLNEVALLKADNERLRIELDERRQAEQFGRTLAPAIPAALVREEEDRGIPALVPALTVACEGDCDEEAPIADDWF